MFQRPTEVAFGIVIEKESCICTGPNGGSFMPPKWTEFQQGTRCTAVNGGISCVQIVAPTEVLYPSSSSTGCKSFNNGRGCIPNTDTCGTVHMVTCDGVRYGAHARAADRRAAACKGRMPPLSAEQAPAAAAAGCTPTHASASPATPLASTGVLFADGNTGKYQCKFDKTKPVDQRFYCDINPPPSSGGGGCFPGAATVRLADGSARRLADLRVGDAILSAADKAGGGLAFRPVYMLAHADAGAAAAFVELEVAEAGAGAPRTLRLTPQHFVPVRARGASAWRYKYARDVAPGDAVHVLAANGSQALVEAAVERVWRTAGRGLFNPLVFGGHPVVDGVLASDQSDWVLDPLTPAALTHLLPSVYGTAMAPLRWAYAVLGAGAWGRLAPALAHVGLHHGSLLLVQAPAALALAVGASSALRAAAGHRRRRA